MKVLGYSRFKKLHSIILCNHLHINNGDFVEENAIAVAQLIQCLHGGSLFLVTQNSKENDRKISSFLLNDLIYLVYNNEWWVILFNQDGAISSLDDQSLKLVNQLIYNGSYISSTESDVYICKAWTVVDRASTILKSDISGKMKWKFFQIVAVSILLYGYTTWT